MTAHRVRARRFYGEHLVVAFHVYAFFLLAMALTTVAGTRLWIFAAHHGIRIGADLVDNAVSMVLVVLMAVYVFGSARRVYGGSVAATALNTAALVAWMAVVYIGYKFILFFTTFYAT